MHFEDLVCKEREVLNDFSSWDLWYSYTARRLRQTASG